jgi:hypothetical protein
MNWTMFRVVFYIITCLVVLYFRATVYSNSRSMSHKSREIDSYVHCLCVCKSLTTNFVFEQHNTIGKEVPKPSYNTLIQL